MSEPRAETRREWYWRMIAEDQEKSARLRRNLRRAQTEPGIPDTQEELDKLLADE